MVASIGVGSKVTSRSLTAPLLCKCGVAMIDKG
jgi:hypothetical protein